MLQLRHARLWFALGWLLVALALIACLAPAKTPGLSGLFAVNDKIEHAAGYMALTLWFAGIYPRSRYLWIAVALFAMGVAVEFLQGWMSLGRNRDPRDVLANTIGIVSGLTAAITGLGGWIQRVEKIFARES